MNNVGQFYNQPAIARQQHRHLRTGRKQLSNSSSVLLQVLLIPSAITLLLWLTSAHEISFLQVACAWLLAGLPYSAYLSWKRNRRFQVPLFVIVAVVYWLYFAVALFWGKHTQSTALSGEIALSSDAITQAMLMAALGITCLWLGIQIKIGKSWLPKRIPDIQLNPRALKYVRTTLTVGTALSLFPGVTYLLGEAGRQFMIGLQENVPLVAFLILFRHCLQTRTSLLDKFLLPIFLVVKFAVAVSTGWMSPMIFTGLAVILVYVNETRRMPWLYIIPALFYVFFFQAGKAAYRAEYWGGSSNNANISEQIAAWFSFSSTAWQQALDDSTGAQRAVLLQDTLMRASLLTQAANVMELTPSQVPYQGGRTYSFLVAMWVPRTLWPDKPLASEANQFYQVAYGLTREENLQDVSISIGATTEGYINFGWWGVAGIMFGIGLLFNWIQRLFLSRDSGILFSAIGVVLASNFTLIEAQMATYVGGVAQRTLLVILIFTPIIYLRRFHSRAQKPSLPLQLQNH
jgi:hypothetical protein